MSDQYKKLLANLGDVNPFDHGGYLVYEVSDCPEDIEAGEVLNDALAEGKDEKAITIRKLMKDVKYEGIYWDEGIEVRDNRYNKYDIFRFDIPKDVQAEFDWVELPAVAEGMGILRRELLAMCRSKKVLERAEAIRAIADYHGWRNVDSDPLNLRRPELEEKYEEDIDELNVPNGWPGIAPHHGLSYSSR